MTEPALQLRRAPAPALRPGAHGPECWNAVTAVTVRATVDLSEDRRFGGQPAHARLEAAVDEERAFLAALLAPKAKVVYDLRLIARPHDSALEIGIVIRCWAGSEHAASARVASLAHGMLRCAPDHVVLKLSTAAELALLLDPLRGAPGPAHAAFVTREEVTARPVRPDVRTQISYHYSVLPWTFPYTDWAPVYRQLSRTTQPLVLSVALMPLQTDPELGVWLDTYATSYGLWATPGRWEGVLYSGARALAPETFAVDAAPTFADYANRLRTQCFAVRILLASPEPLPSGLARAVGATIAATRNATSGRDERGGASGFALRDHDAPGLAAWDLEAVDVCTPGGDGAIWGHPYPPPSPLADLPILCDARDAACAFRLPIAHAGDLPGVRVRHRGRGHVPRSADAPPRTATGSAAGPRVFLCHSSADKAAVRALYERLVADGLSPWLDEEDLLAGEDWEFAIGDAVRAVDFVAICLSNASTTRAGYVHKEIKQALDIADEQPEGTIFVIPVRLEECPLPRRLRHLHCVDLFVEDGYARLTRALQRSSGGSTPAT